MLGLYGFDIHDVFTGKASIGVAQAYLNRLPFEPMSFWRANQLGGPEHMGWTLETYKLADLIDSVQINTVISAHVGSSKAPELPEPVYRPSTPEDGKPEAPKTPTRSLENFNIASIMPTEG